ncbi:MAG: cache domain-containing protein [Elusimicrobia bacterium]|nr:cache domain-containing protein [Elusimicrobiota bacterium]
MRKKLLIGFVLVVLLTGGTAGLVGLHFISSRFYSEMQSQLVYDLNTTRGLFNQALADVSHATADAAERRLAQELLEGRNLAEARRELPAILVREGIDGLAVLDTDGRAVFCAGPGRRCRGKALTDSDIVAKAMASGETVSETLVLPRSDLAWLSPELAERSHILLVPTLKSRPTNDTELTAGLVLAAAAPVRGVSGKVLGSVFGVKLLSRSTDIVDKATDMLYGDRMHRGRHVGTATIFQGDVRIATTVRDEKGERMIGTRGAKDVCEQVLDAGRPWLGRAFVVSEWYLTAYEPIRDSRHRILGMLYVGTLEAPFALLERGVLLVFLGIVLLGTACALVISFVIADRILDPVFQLMTASSRLGKGDLSTRVDIPPGDELGELGRTFNLMADSIMQRDEQIKAHAQEVLKGTERLATIGRLAAGVAHEINNPLGGILVYTHLLLEDTPAADPRRSNIEKVVRETERVRRIVRGLLEFARETESRVEENDLNDLVLKTLDLVHRQLLLEKVSLVKDLAPALPPIPLDGDRIRQVLLNLILNAVESMEGKGGSLTIATRHRLEAGTVEASIADTGCGISAENKKRLFEPFFTTKPVGKGTGLGLAISYGIVKKHGGAITVESAEGKGTTFTIVLPTRGI